MGEAIKHGFANLTNFAGRDSRTLFWWWVLLIVVITFGLSFISGIFFTAGAIRNRIFDWLKSNSQ